MLSKDSQIMLKDKGINLALELNSFAPVIYGNSFIGATFK